MFAVFKKRPMNDANKPRNIEPKVMSVRLGLERFKGICAGSNTLNTGVSFCNFILASVV
jgi:hypothetical protein